MRSATTLLLVLTLAYSKAQFQVVNENNSIGETEGLHEVVILSDGSLLTSRKVDGVMIFRKFNLLGQEIWARGMEVDQPLSIPQWFTVPVLPDQNGGFLTARYMGISSAQDPLNPSWFVDRSTIQFIRIDNAGMVTWVQSLRDSVYLSDWRSIRDFHWTMAPNGNLLVHCQYDVGGFYSNDFIQFDPSGTILFARSIGAPIGMSWPPTFVSEYDPIHNVLWDPSGAIYVVHSGQNASSPIKLTRLSASADVAWVKQYVYGTSWNVHNEIDSDFGSDGRIHIASYMNNSVGNFFYQMRADTSGLIDRIDLYRVNAIAAAGRLRVDSNDRRYYLLGGYGSWSGVTLISDTLGNAGLLKREQRTIVLPHNVLNSHYSCDLVNDRLAMAGWFAHEHVDFGFTRRYASLLSAHVDEIQSCTTSDTLLAHIPVPLDLITTTELNNWVSVDISAHYSIEPSSVTLMDLDPEPIEALCSFASDIIGIDIGLEEHEDQLAPLVSNNLVQQGQAFELLGAAGGSLDLLSMEGRLVQRLPWSRFIPTDQLRAGLYILRSSDGRLARVMVE